MSSIHNFVESYSTYSTADCGKRKVNIICTYPFRFRPPNPRIHNEPYDAVTATPEITKTLIFAAASNLGFEDRTTTYPGCLSQSSKLICLFATAGDGDPESLPFIPATIPNTHNFALLGEGIRIDREDGPVGGTSGLTIIAAAIAAYIMDFVNHSDIKNKIRDVRYLRQLEGITSILKA